MLKHSKKPFEFVESIIEFLAKLRNYNPDLKSLRIDYLDKSTELKLLLSIPQNISHQNVGLEIPACMDLEIVEAFDAISLNKVNLNWQKKNNKWVASAKDLAASDKYFLILKGSIAAEALNDIIQLYCPRDPKRTSELDLYWIDSAIKDMTILDKIEKELTVDKVTTTINVGLERQFSSSIPTAIKEYFRARAEADIHLASRNPDLSYRSAYRLRMAKRTWVHFLREMYTIWLRQF